MMTQRHVAVHPILIDCSKSKVFQIPSPERTCLVRHLSNKRSRIRQLSMNPNTATVSFDIGIALSLAPIIILHVLRSRQNQCFGNCMGFAKLSNSMSNYIRCLQTLLRDGGLLLLEAITFMFKEVHRLFGVEV